VDSERVWRQVHLRTSGRIVMRFIDDWAADIAIVSAEPAPQSFSSGTRLRAMMQIA
jgi:hypothetical protein